MKSLLLKKWWLVLVVLVTVVIGCYFVYNKGYKNDIFMPVSTAFIDNDKNFDYKIADDLSDDEVKRVISECWGRTLAAYLGLNYEDYLTKVETKEIKTIELDYPYADWEAKIEEGKMKGEIDVSRPLALEFVSYETGEKEERTGPVNSIGPDGSIKYVFDFKAGKRPRISVYVNKNFPEKSSFASGFLGALAIVYNGKSVYADKNPIGSEEAKIEELLFRTDFEKKEINPVVYGVKDEN